MKLCTFTDAGRQRVGALDGEAMVDLTDAGIAGTMLALIEAGAPALEKARAAVAGGGGRRLPLASARLEAPIPRPGKILCSGINYKSHADENPDARMPEEPFFFAKMPSAVVGPEAAIPYPPRTRQLDYEVELAVVVGERLARADERAVMPAIFGYTLLHDVSARDVQFKDNQITLGKNFDGFCPLGPCIVTADAMERPDRVRLRTRVNGETMQDGTTADWLFPLPRLLSFLSHVMTLEPGDVVSTGTPAGVGLFRRPQVFLKPGDVVEIEADGIGVLRNRVVAAAG
jgi:2-keto-4-pentenoate hydratase/2-oxohepta-3-ene-1,7-dioic acid hydratase in catechol pathway